MSEWTLQRTVGSVSVEGTDESVEWLLTARDGIGDVGVRGSLRIRFDAGHREPRYWYHVGSLIHTAPEIGVLQRQRTLTLCSDLCGATELFDLQGDARAAQLLVRAALLWLSRDAPSTHRVFAELSGGRAPNGEAAHAGGAGVAQSSFFNAVLRHFLPASQIEGPGEFGRRPADFSGLLPRHPLYVAMLPSHVQAQIGQAGVDDRHWQAALSEEGLEQARMVSVVDAGPVHEGGLQACRMVQAAGWREVMPLGEISSDADPGLAVAMLLDGERDIAHVVRCRCQTGLLQLQDEDLAARWPAGTKVWCAPCR